MQTIVAIHSTALGPAAGGTRFKAYEAPSQAMDDALRLSRSMSYKSALAGLPVGGGKAVIIGDPGRLKSRELLHAYGRFIDRIGSHFATGEDVGMSMADIETIKEVTPFVGGTSEDAGDPSVHTAVGVLHGLRAVLQAQFRTDSFEGVRVAVQGLGAVGWGVAERLHEGGATLVVSDIRADLVQAAADRLGATPCAPADIHRADVEIFAPCALGGVVTPQTAEEIRARAVAGSANNQLASPEAGAALASRGILFAPDYVINAGGIISGLEATSRMPGRARSSSRPLPEALAAIRTRLLEIFERSRVEGRRPEVAAEEMARELIGRSAH
ncbi:Leu/Phe/Val dehydrogenase [Sphingosinicella terrae]|uniref:Leu/Phe/Val dehydrogenase n=1 Tax=Sphingosinicella terrae TaxID=2172047 RepID=UPI0013B395FB|nr:Glu/Leu/Phe/Val dehydrogenase dimerization domain-containing protein [Sphingosinicella terrae]